MISSILLGTALLTAGPVRDTLAPPDLEAYETAKASSGRDAGAQVKLALWCEAHGLQAERVKHLALAVLNDPSNALARGLMGLVAYRGRWQRPEAIGEKARADDLLAEYRDRRANAPDTADGQWDLARWCEQKGLKAEANAHDSAVVRLDPKRDAAWRHLGYKKQGGRWVNEAQLAAEKADADAQKQADRHWKPLLEKWRERLDSKSETKRLEADDALADITDPRAVPMIWAVFASGRPERQAVAVRILGQIDAAGASRALAMLAVFGRSAEVRRIATETLRRRDVREFADLLIALLRDPIKYEVKSVGGPGSPGEIHLQGKTVDVKRRYSPPSAPNVPVSPGDSVTLDANGLPVIRRTMDIVGPTGWIPVSELFNPTRSGIDPAQERRFLGVMAGSGLGPKGQQIGQNILDASRNSTALNWTWNVNTYQAMALQSLSQMRAFPSTKFNFLMGEQAIIPVGQMQLEAQKAAVGAQQQLQNDVKALEQHNAPIKKLNEQVVLILRDVSGQNLGEDRETWQKWLVDQLGYNILAQKASEKTTIVEDVPLAYQPQAVPVDVVTAPVGYRRVSCFGAGTPVHTLDGVRPIESLKVGDQVLTQNLRSGALGYKPILVVHHNPPSKTFRINLDDETIVSSEFHRFWKVGKGWVMARDLKAGDTVRNLGGVVQVAAIDDGAVQPVFNLDVADDADFFVGRQGALVHDNTLPDLRQAPFDAPPALAATR